MNKVLLCAVVLIVFAGVMSSCSQPSTPALPTPAPLSLPTLIPPTKIPATPTATPTPVPPTPTTLPTATATVARTQGASVASSPTIAMPTLTATPAASPTPPPSPTPAIPRGLYVTDLRIEPAPARGLDLKFYATFLNSMEREQNYRWAVYIFRADNQRGIGETTRTDTAVPVGTGEQLSIGSWKLPLGGPCDYFYAQVGWLNVDSKIVWFTTPSGSVFQKGFTVCPP